MRFWRAVAVPRATRLAPWPGLAERVARVAHSSLHVKRRSLLAAPAIALVASSLMPLRGARAQSQLKGDLAKKPRWKRDRRIHPGHSISDSDVQAVLARNNASVKKVFMGKAYLIELQSGDAQPMAQELVASGAVRYVKKHDFAGSFQAI